MTALAPDTWRPSAGRTASLARSAASSGEPYRFATRSSVVLRCRACKNTSLTAGTVMQSSHMPLSTWFWGAYLMTTQTPGQSAVQFQRQLDPAG